MLLSLSVWYHLHTSQEEVEEKEVKEKEVEEREVEEREVEVEEKEVEVEEKEVEEKEVEVKEKVKLMGVTYREAGSFPCSSFLILQGKLSSTLLHVPSVL